MKRFLRILTAFDVLRGAVSFAAPSAPGDERLKELFGRFPQAVLNKDGKLTREEARAYLHKMKPAKSGDAPPSPHADIPASLPSTKGLAGKRARRGGDAPKPDLADVSYGSHPNN